MHTGAAAAERLAEERGLLRKLGWVIEVFGADAVAVQGLPAILRRPDPESALNEILRARIGSVT